MLSLKEKLKEQILSAKTAAVGRIAEKILSYAATEDIDEIVLGKKEKEASVEFFYAGEAKGRLSISEKIKEEVANTFKELASLEKGENSGSFKKQSLGKKTVFSLAVYNSGPEEKIVIKVGACDFGLIDIGRLGFEKKSLAKIKSALDKKRGLILDIGPFNSGKTSTLYSLIGYVNQNHLNITTLEKEISYDIPSVNQSELSYREGFGYPFPLSPLLRQDPDVVMVDEISDKEAVEAVLHLSERGYLVLAGLYGADFSATFDFLAGLGVSLPLFCENASIMINQRLVRRNCSNCLKKFKISQEQAERLKEIVSETEILGKMRREKIIPAKVSHFEKIEIFKSQGCEKCRQSGFSGEIGVFEILEITPAVSKALRAGHFSAAAAEIKKQDNFTLAEAAFAKLCLGIMSLEEFLRAVS